MKNYIGILFVLLTSAEVASAQEFAFPRSAPAHCASISVDPVCPAAENSAQALADASGSVVTANPFAVSDFSAGSKSSKTQPREYATRPKSTHDAFDLAVGMEYFRFRSSLYTANLVGLHTSFTYFRYDWLGLEGNVVASFGSSNLLNESSRAVLYAAGPRIAWRERRVQPWLHALVGGLHIRPQTASNINGLAFQLGGGADWRFKPLISFRAESDYVRSQVNSSGQNSFQFGGGVVFHF